MASPRYTIHPQYRDADENISIDLSVTLGTASGPVELSGVLSEIDRSDRGAYALCAVDHVTQMVALEGGRELPLSAVPTR